MKTLVLIEHDNTQLKSASLATLGAAKQLGHECHALVIGHECNDVAIQCAAIDAVDAVILVDAIDYKVPMAECISEVMVELARDFDAILAPATTFGKNIVPRVAALLDVGQISDVTKIIDEKTFEHPVYAGNAIEKLESLDEKIVLSIRPTAFDAASIGGSQASIKKIEFTCSQNASRYLKSEVSASERPELGEASIVVSGGRGLQDGEKFSLIEELADCLGAAVGASRAAVDAGFVPNDYQVGQTGKVVAPTLYIAVGISGAIQHLAGMKESKIIVAINKDEEAPIFQIASYGLVGDLFDIVPELIEKLKSNA